MFEVLRNLFRRSTTTPTVIASSKMATPTLTVTSADATCSANSASPVFVDTETTGLNQDGTDEVLEIAIVDSDGSTLINTLVRPVRNTTWPHAQVIHGISPQDVANAPTGTHFCPRSPRSVPETVVLNNAPFDTSFFPTGFFLAAACAMRRYSELSPERIAWVKLADAANASGYASTGASHRALEDALACRHVWLFGISCS